MDGVGLPATGGIQEIHLAYDLLVRCQNPHIVHLYADRSFTYLFSCRYSIASFASANELYIVFLHGDSTG